MPYPLPNDSYCTWKQNASTYSYQTLNNHPRFGANIQPIMAMRTRAVNGTMELRETVHSLAVHGTMELCETDVQCGNSSLTASTSLVK